MAVEQASEYRIAKTTVARVEPPKLEGEDPTKVDPVRPITLVGSSINGPDTVPLSTASFHLRKQILDFFNRVNDTNPDTIRGMAFDKVLARLLYFP